MAKMYPPRLEQTPGTGALGEALVYNELAKLPDDWVVIHDYWRYYLDSRAEHVNYELDFIVLVPGRGFVVIEVKNWHAAEVRDGQWYFMGKKGKYMKLGHKLSPLHQAYLGCKKLNDELCRVRRFADWYVDELHRGRVEYHSLAVLLNQTADQLLSAVDSVEADAGIAREHSVPLQDLYICGEAALRDNLQARIERLFSKQDSGRYLSLQQTHIDQIVKYLLPSFHLKGDPAAFNRIMEEATASVHSLLPMLEESRGGICVTGCAGSGKTWIAVREVARLSRLHGTGKRILFTCYNVALSEHLRRLPELQRGLADGSVTLLPFPALCRALVKRPLDSWEAQRKWYLSLISDTDTSAIDEALSSISPSDCFDYIFIDECQDFLASWGRLISALSKPDTQTYYFSDDNQNLFVGSGAQAYCPAAPTRVRLRRNLRNSAEIARFSSAMLSPEHRMLPLDIPGLRVEICKAEEDVHERARLVSFWLHRLIRGSGHEPKDSFAPSRCVGVRPHQIVVLSPYAPYKQTEKGATAPDPKCSLPLVADIVCRSAKLSAEQLLMRWETDESVTMGTTIRAFKGLEADFVILVDVDSPLGDDKALSPNDMYVACTRAKYGLIIIPRSEAGELYVRQLQNSGGK